MHPIRMWAVSAIFLALTLLTISVPAQPYVNFEGKQTRDLVSNQAVLNWPLSAVGFNLEQTASLATPAWSDDTNAVEIVNRFNFVTNSASDSTKFFRLRQQ